MTTTDHDTGEEAIEYASLLLARHANGEADREAAEEIAAMVQAVRDTGKKGHVIVKFEATEAGERQIILTAQVSSKIPKPSPEIGIYWVSNQGLHHSDPWQQSFFDAVDPDTGEIRNPSEAPDIDPTTAKTIED